MNLLVLNSGSSSLKFAAWRSSTIVLRGQIEQIGNRAQLVIGRKIHSRRAATILEALKLVNDLLHEKNFVPTTVAHRVVHGGPWYKAPVKITATVLHRLETLRPMAPLHLPNNLRLIAAAKHHWPLATAWAVFDTAVYHDLPAAARLYALPRAITKKYGLRKYGFHGISHAWAFGQAAKRLRHSPSRMNAVTIHLGAGDSMTLWHRGRPVDTSMGFTPLEGLTMATRSGDIDPMIPLYLQTQGKFSIRQVTAMLNHQSGLFGLTGLRDIRDVLGAAGHPVAGWRRRSWSARQRRQAKLALDIFRYDIQRYLSSYAGLTKHLHAIIFTGSVGQNRVVQRLVLRGVQYPRATRVVTIPADEEVAIAEALRRVIH